MDYRCPNCGSENTQRYSVIYNNGVSNYSSETEISGYVERDFLHSDSFSGTASTQGVSITNLAQTVAPPQKESEVGCGTVVGSLIVVAVIHGILSCFIDKGFLLEVIDWGILLLFGFLLYYENKRSSEYNNNVYPQLYNDWLNSYVCMRCGHHFIKK